MIYQNLRKVNKKENSRPTPKELCIEFPEEAWYVKRKGEERELLC
jgi:hypothetical protein